MKYRAKKHTKHVLKRIARHKRTRYHNDSYLFETPKPSNGKPKKSFVE